MTMPRVADLLAPHNMSSLRLAAFCAEPVNAAVHRFGVEHFTPNYINCYWATEHGGVVWGLQYEHGRHVRPDTSSWPLPWISAAVMMPLHDLPDESVRGYRSSLDGEQGDVVIRNRYPYMALTVWSSDRYGEYDWVSSHSAHGHYQCVARPLPDHYTSVARPLRGRYEPKFAALRRTRRERRPW